MPLSRLAFLLLVLGGFYKVDGTYRYYGTYLPYGVGETYIWVYHQHGGSNLPHHKWQVECLDGEAMTGLQDYVQDFERLEVVKCQFIFPHKPPTNGLYPYYPSCHVRNYTNQYFCYDSSNHDRTANTFVTAIWDSGDFQYLVYRPGADDLQLYKCCKTPAGYYIDYVSCYYMPTHDLYFEYYDSTSNMVTMCATGYVATGISKKINPWTSLYNVDYIQCCRVGYGPNRSFSSSVFHHGKDQTPVYYSREAIERIDVPEGYRAQYRRRPEAREGNGTDFNVTLLRAVDPVQHVADGLHIWSSRYAKGPPRGEIKDSETSPAKAWPTYSLS